MTGHDLDLDALVADYEHVGTRTLYTRDPEQVHRDEAAERLVDAVPALLAEVESLRAKLAATEQERDRLQGQSNDRMGIIVRQEAALAAVRELAGTWKRRNWSITEGAACDQLFHAIAAAEQDEPKQHCATLGHEAIPATITGTLWEGDDPDTGIRTAYCDECAQALAGDAVFTPDEPKREQS